MSNTDQEKIAGKSGKKKQKRSKKPDQAERAMPDQQQAAKELIDAAIASTEASPAAAVAAADASPAESPPAVEAPSVAEAASAEVPPVAEPAPVEAPPIAEAAPTEAPSAEAARPETATPVGLQTIATAYRDYTKKSIEDARSYVEKLSSVRTLDKAVEVQTEFAKQAYETFAADSRKIRDLYGELFKQTMRLPMSPFDRARNR